MVAVLEIELISFRVVRVTLEQGGSFVAEQFHFENVYNCKSDFILHIENILHLAVVSLGPQVITIRGIDKLNRDSQAIPRASDAPFQYSFDT